MLVNFKDILDQKIQSKIAVGAFNTVNLEITQGIVRGAVASGQPVVIQATENALDYAGFEALFSLIKFTIERESHDVPIAIHLDHGKKLETVRKCIELGFSSVHMDASEYGFEDNIKMTKEAVSLGHQHNILVQGELGNIYGQEGLIKMQQGEDINKLMTNPDQVKEFVQRTGVDTIAVSLGNLHGHFVGQENLDFNRLQKIADEIHIPIVLHGGSGIANDQITKAISLGVRIINVDTDLRMAFQEALKTKINLDPDLVDPRKLLKPAVEKISQVVQTKIKLFNLE